MVNRFDVFMCDTGGVELPCLVVSPGEMNSVLSYVMVAPITSIERAYPFRVVIGLTGKKGQIALDMIKTVEKSELSRKIGVLPEASHEEILTLLNKIFSK